MTTLRVPTTPPVGTSLPDEELPSGRNAFFIWNAIETAAITSKG